MSVVVRMEMPENCGECRFRPDGWCYGIREFDPQPGPLDFEKRPSWCPIICQLPERHGALIDLETAAEGLSERYNSCHMTCGAVMQFLDGLPTIVPAEAERSET